MFERATRNELQTLRRLSGRRSARTDAGLAVIEGPKAVFDLLADGLEPDAIYLSDDFVVRLDEHDEWAELTSLHGSVVRGAATGPLAQALDSKTPQGVAALVAMPSTPLDVVLDAARAGGLVLVADGLQDPGNVGAIIRVAEGSGCAGLIATSDSADPFGPKALRASAGSAFRVPIAIVERDELLSALSPASAASAANTEAAAAGSSAIAIWSADHGGIAAEDADLAAGGLLLLGSEGAGPSDQLSAIATGAIEIPLEGRIESLNVATAAAVLAFGAAAQRRSRRTPDSGAGE